VKAMAVSSGMMGVPSVAPWRRQIEQARVAVGSRVAPGVVYTTFHHPDTQVNVVTTEYSDWATNCPEYKVTAVQVSPSNGPTEWQQQYNELARNSRRVAVTAEAAE